ncbi:Uncharacterized membrane protein YckC, RDD family [Micromonospora rhizosphaerae]|uniref:Uncharacterized membrane protein YckC, RDD family n=2 Tax=Micromonospora rhizosphaerae TaxID=568872 RepID=A0A1C6RBN0_9ACTN|nr:Uncharacterized membrane protein YckC, RDD family [Micromonospora rhizosphaerae]
MTPPPAGPPPAGGGFAPPSGPTPGYVPPAQHTPSPYARIAAYPGPPPGWAPHPGLAPPPLAPNGRPLAGFGDRLLAMLVDTAVFVVIGMVLAVPATIVLFAVVMPDLMAVNSDGSIPEPDLVNDFLLPFLWVELAVLAISLLLGYVYYVEMMFRTGQTLGKKVMKLRVVPRDPARALDRRMAVRRFLVQNVAGLVPGFGYLDGFWQLWDKPWQQCLHDKFAGTVVVKVSA